MTKRNYLILATIALFFVSLFVPKTLGIALLVISILSGMTVGIRDWTEMSKREDHILIKFDISIRRKLGLKDVGFALGDTAILFC